MFYWKSTYCTVSVIAKSRRLAVVRLPQSSADRPNSTVARSGLRAPRQGAGHSFPAIYTHTRDRVMADQDERSACDLSMPSEQAPPLSSGLLLPDVVQRIAKEGNALKWDSATGHYEVHSACKHVRSVAAWTVAGGDGGVENFELAPRRSSMERCLRNSSRSCAESGNETMAVSPQSPLLFSQSKFFGSCSFRLHRDMIATCRGGSSLQPDAQVRSSRTSLFTRTLQNALPHHRVMMCICAQQ